MSSRNLKYWLPRHRPTSIVAYDENEKEHKIKIDDKRSKWTNVLRSLEAVHAVRLVAYDAKGEVMAGMEVDPDDPGGDDAAEKENQTLAAGGVLGQPALNMKVRDVDFASVLATGMQIAANLAVEAADRAMARHEEAYAGRREDMREAMNQFATVTRMVTDRLVHLEKAWHAVMTERATTASETDDGEKLAMQVIDRAFPKVNGAPNGATNGEKKKPEPLT